MVTVTVAVIGADPVSEIELGDTVQVDSDGAPLHESATAPLNPPTDVKVTVDVVELPGAIVAGANTAAESWKSGGGGTAILINVTTAGGTSTATSGR